MIKILNRANDREVERINDDDYFDLDDDYIYIKDEFDGIVYFDRKEYYAVKPLEFVV